MQELNKAQGAGIPSEVIVKEDSVRNLLLIFTDCVTVKFKLAQGDKIVTGRWCMECK